MSVTKTDKEVRFIQTTSANYAAQTEIISDAIYFLTDTKEIYVGSTKYSQSVNLKNGTGANSIMMLSSKEASGDASHAEGFNTGAVGGASHAEGYYTTASGVASHAEGFITGAACDGSHAEGSATRAGQHAFQVNNLTPGEGTTGTLTLSSVEGLAVGKRYSAIVEGKFIFDCGEITAITTDNTEIVVDSYPDIMYTEPQQASILICIVDDPSLGDLTIGGNAHAEGTSTIALSDSSHAEGQGTKAYGKSSHAEGLETVASGPGSHAEGGGTTASGLGSHAEGQHTTASSNYSHVQGQFNVEDSSNTYAHIIGNGLAENSRSNAHTVEWSGNAWYAGDVYVGSTSGTNKDEGSKKLATEEYVDSASISVDTSLSIAGRAADAAAVGNRLSALSEEIAAIPSGKDGADGKSAYQYAVEGGYTGTETEFAEKMAKEKFANPNALTFTGAVTGTYDGSKPFTVEIPSGGGGSAGDVSWKLIRTINIVSGTSNYSFNTDNNGNAFKVKNFLILIDTYPAAGGYLEIKTNDNFSFVQKPTGKKNYPFSFMMKRLTDMRYILENSISVQSTFERKISGKYSSFGEFTSFSFWFSDGAASDTTMYILGEDV